jgi:glc operon protein GlcG
MRSLVPATIFCPLAFAIFALSVPAQTPSPYGAPISLATAKKVAAGALAEAVKNNWAEAVAIVDPGGSLVYFERMDNTNNASANISIGKARTAALFKRPSKAFQDALAAGGVGLRVLRLKDAVPLEGGVPLIENGKVIGAIGVSGDAADRDSQCANAAAETLK